MSGPTTPVRTVAVIGAGVMGVGISEVLLAGGVDVRVHDVSTDALQTFGSRLDTARTSHETVVDDADGHCSVHVELAEAVASAHLVIECGPEDPDLKAALFADLDRLTPRSTVIASNTSSIPLAVLGAQVEHRDRLLGMHFWNPPALVPLVEVVRPPAADPTLADAMLDALRSWGLTPVLVAADVPGIVGNRLQHALKREAIALVAAGVCSAETVDLVVTSSFGSRLGSVGPLEQSDLSGTDLTLAIHEVLMPHLDTTPVAHPYLVEMVERGDLGARTGQGFRSWAPGEAERRRAEIASALVGNRRARPPTGQQTGRKPCSGGRTKDD